MAEQLAFDFGLQAPPQAVTGGKAWLASQTVDRVRARAAVASSSRLPAAPRSGLGRGELMLTNRTV
jgi:hypothetical protein